MHSWVNVISEDQVKTLARLASALLLAGAAAGASAQSASTTFQVTANVAASCSVTATDLAFGQYDPFAATPLDSTSTISITCTNMHGYAYSVPTPTARSMAGPGAATLNYGLYNEAARTSGFGGAGTGNGSAQSITVYGRIPAGQTLAVVGSYSDLVTVTVNY
jgi:spore coat protein U-like protein